MISRLWLSLVCAYVLLACQSDPSTHDPENDRHYRIADIPFVAGIEDGHKAEDFLNKNAVQFDLQLFFGGEEWLNGKISLLTNSTRGTLLLQNGDTIRFDNENVYISDTSTTDQKIRFTAYTWPYFFLLPYKLNDPGTVWSDYPNSTLNGTSYNAKRLSFEPEVGDAPDDWYIVYTDTATDLIKAAAYIVTAGKTVEEAEKDPHAIQYDKYMVVEGIPIATHWMFRTWRADGGMSDTIGYAYLSNIQFIDSIP